jgi:DNA repair protein RadD
MSEAQVNAGLESTVRSVPLVLRPYQEECINRLRSSYAAGHRAPLFQLPTGGGKTVIFGAIAASAMSRGRRVLITVHRRELLRQASEKLSWAGVPHGIIAAGSTPELAHQVQVASIQTLARRDSPGRFDLIIIDEAHHARAKSWAALLSANPTAKILGVTATPARLDGKGLGVTSGGHFDDIVSGPSIRELTELGFLCPSRYFLPAGTKPDLKGVKKRGGDYVAEDLAKRVDTKGITGSAVAKYRELAHKKPAIAFCALVSHAEHVAEEFCQAGYRAAAVHGEMPKPQRDELIAGLGNGSIDVLTSCDLISEGLDVPALGAVILLRPTASLVLHMQQIGRGMRPAPQKPYLVVLDHVGNISRHGLPEIDLKWSLDGVEVPPNPRLKRCPKCACISDGSRECPNCGYRFKGAPRAAPAKLGGTLEELSQERRKLIISMTYRQVVAANLSEAELKVYASHRGYQQGWIWHRIKGHPAFSGAA